MTGIDFFWFMLIQATAGFIIGTTSFGGNLFSIPLVTLLMSARDAIVIGCLSFWCSIFAVMIIYRKHLLWREIIILSIAGVIGAPFGSWLLAHASMRFLLLAAGCAVTLFLIWQFIAPKISKKETTLPDWMAWPCGILAGVMSGTVGMGGPPVAFYAYMRHWSKESTIGGLSAAFLAQLVVIVFTQWAQGLYTLELLKLSLWASLAISIGLILSVPLVKHINIAMFRYLVLAMLTLSSLILFIKGFSI